MHRVSRAVIMYDGWTEKISDWEDELRGMIEHNNQLGLLFSSF